MKRYLCLAAVVSALFVSLPAFAGKNDATVTVMNESSYELTAVYVCGPSDSDWGDDVLSATIRSGRDRDITVPKGYVQLMAVFDVDGTEVSVTEEAEFEARATYEWTLTDEMVEESYYGSYDYGSNYGYYDDSYGYYDDSYYGSYGYYEDTYGYYGY